MKKGFTLIEILGVIVILGLLLLLLTPTVYNRINVQSSKTKDVQDEMIKDAAEEYVLDNDDLYPMTKGNKYCITVSELKSSGKLPEELKNVETGDNYDDNTGILVTVEGDKVASYEIRSNSDCTNSSSSNSTGSIAIKVSPDNDTWSQSKMVSITYPDYGDGYQYCYNKYYGNSLVENKCFDKRNIGDIRFDSIGRIEAYVGKDGSSYINKSESVNKIDRTPPTCSISTSGKNNGNIVYKNGEIIRNLNGTPYLWYTGDVTISSSSSDTTPKNELMEKESGIYKTGLVRTTSNKPNYNGKNSLTQSTDSDLSNAAVYYCYAKDKAGNEYSTYVNVYRDTLKPKCDISFSGSTNGNDYKNDANSNYTYTKDANGSKSSSERGQWYKDRVTVSLIADDLDRDGSNSGTINYGLGTNANPSNYNTSSGMQNDDTNGTVWYGKTVDAAGNISTCNRTVFKDSVRPSCNLSISGRNNGRYFDNYHLWYTDNVTISFNSTYDEISGVGSRGISSSSTPSYSDSTGLQRGDAKGINWYGYVRDKAGNTNSCSILVYKDSQKPECSISFSGSKKDNSTKWFTSSVTASLAKEDINKNNIQSGTESYALSTNANPSNYNTNSGMQYSDTKGTTWYGKVVDKAGNVSTCNNIVYKDTVNPTCSLTTSGSNQGKYQNGHLWYTGNVTISFNSTYDETSGIASKGIATGSTSYANSSGTQYNNTTGTTWNGYVKDVAGNTGSCSTEIYKDSTKPTCSLSVLSNNKFSWSCSDSGGSELRGYLVTKTSAKPDVNAGWNNNYSSNTYDTNGNSGTYYLWAIDNAGNISDKLYVNTYKVSRSQGAGTTLNTQHDGYFGNSFTGSVYVLGGSSVYVSASADRYYHDLTLTKNGSNISGIASYAITENTTFASSASVNTLTIRYHGNGGTQKYSSNNGCVCSGNVCTRQINPIDNPSLQARSFNLNDADNLFSNAYYHVDDADAWKKSDGSTLKQTDGVDLLSYVYYGNATLDLYANWKANVLTINYYGNGGSKQNTQCSSDSSCSWNGSHWVRKLSYGSYLTSFNLNNADNLYKRTYFHIDDSDAWKVGNGSSKISQGSVNLLNLVDLRGGNATLNLHANWKGNTITLHWHANGADRKSFNNITGNNNGRAGGNCDATTYSGKCYTCGSKDWCRDITYNPNRDYTNWNIRNVEGIFERIDGKCGYRWKKDNKGSEIDQCGSANGESWFKTDGATIQLYAVWHDYEASKCSDANKTKAPVCASDD